MSRGSAERRAADYPPPFSSEEVIAAPTDAPDERIDVGVLIVGGGPAGSRARSASDSCSRTIPRRRERLGDVPSP